MKQQTKNRLLILGFLISCLLVYRLTLKPTLEVKERLSKAKIDAIQYKNLNQLEANLISKEIYIDSILTKNNINSNGSIQNNLLKQLSSNKDVIIADFKEPHSIEKDGLTITSYQFVLKGGYTSLEKTITSLEQNFSLGEIKSVHFEKKRDHRKRKDYLECSIIFEVVSS